MLVMDTLKWVVENKQWLFSGIGGAAILTILTILEWMQRKPSHFQQLSGGVGSQNVQAGRDVNITGEGRSGFLQRRREAASKLYSALAEDKAQIIEGKIDPHYLMNKHKVKHDTAISEVRPFVNLDQLGNFDAKVQKFSECRRALEPALLQFYRSKATGQPVDQSANFNLIVAINELLTFSLAPKPQLGNPDFQPSSASPPFGGTSVPPVQKMV